MNSTLNREVEPVCPVEILSTTSTLMSIMKLALEQQFALVKYAESVSLMSLEQAQESLRLVYLRMLRMEAYYQPLLKQSWGIDPVDR